MRVKVRRRPLNIPLPERGKTFPNYQTVRLLGLDRKSVILNIDNPAQAFMSYRFYLYKIPIKWMGLEANRVAFYPMYTDKPLKVTWNMLNLKQRLSSDQF